MRIRFASHGGGVRVFPVRRVPTVVRRLFRSLFFRSQRRTRFCGVIETTTRRWSTCTRRARRKRVRIARTYTSHKTSLITVRLRVFRKRKKKKKTTPSSNRFNTLFRFYFRTDGGGGRTKTRPWWSRTNRSIGMGSWAVYEIASII